MSSFKACDNRLINRLVVKGFMIMTAPIANANIQQPISDYDMAPEYRPSYNAVQINMATPTVNAPTIPPMPETATKEWTA